MLLTMVLALAEGGDNIIQPDLSLILVIVLFLIFVVVVNKILFKPITTVLDERYNLTVGASDEARAVTRSYQRRLADYEARIREARAESYREAELQRAAALERRRQLIEQVKQQTAQQIEEAKSNIRNQVKDARAALETESRQIAQGIARTLLGRTVGGGAD
ncbi:MAG TPA: ATP synthase F0 subunit B [Blastocatellia bacterium]|nr:ATP synthase F0 subunit B [Blastocatellia bacterium]